MPILLFPTIRDGFEASTCSSLEVVGDTAFITSVGTTTVIVLAMTMASFPLYSWRVENLNCLSLDDGRNWNPPSSHFQN